MHARTHVESCKEHLYFTLFSSYFNVVWTIAYLEKGCYMDLGGKPCHWISIKCLFYHLNGG